MNVSPAADSRSGAFCFIGGSDRGNLGPIVKREGRQAQRRLSQEHVMNVTLATNERVTSTMNSI
jgi:hypothetical protein